MLRSAVFAFVSALPVLGCAAARPRMAPVAPADAAYATPRLAHPLPAGAHYERSSELDVEDSALRSGGVAADEVFREDFPTRLLGIVDDAIFFRRGRALFRHRLPDGKDEQLTGDTEPLAAVAVDGDEAFYATLDCDVFSTKQYRLGGECPGSVRDLFVDGTSLYMIADESTGFRETATALYRMARRRDKAVRLATLPHFDRAMGPERVLFDGAAFYYLDTFGTVMRVPKTGGGVERFLTLEPMSAQEVEFVGEGAIYVKSGGDLLRAPLDGSKPSVVASHVGGHFASDGKRLWVVNDGALSSAPLAGGWLERVTPLPGGDLWPFAIGNAIYLLGYDAVYAVNPNAARAAEVYEVDDRLIGSLAKSGRGLFFTQEGDEDSVGVFRLDRPGAATECFTEPALAAAPALDDDVFFLLRRDGTLVRRALDAAADQPLITGNALAALAGKAVPTKSDRESAVWSRSEDAELARDVVLDEKHVYWVDAALQVVARIEKSGGAPEIVLGDVGTLDRLLVDPRFVYVVRATQKTLGVLRLAKTAGATPEVLFESDDFEPRLTLTADGSVVTTPQSTLVFSRSVGIRQLPLLVENGRVGVLEGAGDTLFFSGGGYDPDPTLRARRLGEPYDRLYSKAFTYPSSLLVTADSVYAVELGFAASPKSSARRVGCCEIWRLPR